MSTTYPINANQTTFFVLNEKDSERDKKPPRGMESFVQDVLEIHEDKSLSDAEKSRKINNYLKSFEEKYGTH